MISLKKITLICCLVTMLSVGTAAWGAEPNEIGLTFQMSSALGPAPSLFIVPTYVAAVARNGSHWFPEPGASEMVAFLDFVQTQGISRQQREFLQVTRRGLTTKGSLNLMFTPPNEPNAPRLLLYAVSADDAKKMAGAYLRFARGQFNEWVTLQQSEIKKMSERLAEERQKQPEAGRAEEAATKAFEEMQKQVPYRDEKQALDAAAELNKMLNTAQVDIAGIQAMLQAIQNHLTSLPRDSSNEAVKSKLEVMFVEESISLRAAEARKRMATTLRKQADSYIDLKTAWEQAEGEKNRLAHDVPILSREIKQAQDHLDQERQQEPGVINNKVFIHPLTQDQTRP